MSEPGLTLTGILLSGAGAAILGALATTVGAEIFQRRRTAMTTLSTLMIELESSIKLLAADDDAMDGIESDSGQIPSHLAVPRAPAPTTTGFQACAPYLSQVGTDALRAVLRAYWALEAVEEARRNHREIQRTFHQALVAGLPASDEASFRRLTTIAAAHANAHHQYIAMFRMLAAKALAALDAQRTAFDRGDRLW